MKANKNRRWVMCPTCKCLKFATDLAKHKCNEKVLAKLDVDLDMVVDEEMTTWDKDVRNFWNSKDVKYMQWRLEKGLDEK